MKPGRFARALSFVSVVGLSCAEPVAPPASVQPSGEAAVSLAQRARAPASSCALPAKPVESKASDTNVEGAPLEVCSQAPLTGFFRDGKCSTGREDTGVHVVCSAVTDAFLAYTRDRGNDLVTPRGSFAGLKAGDRWCLCAARWREADEAGVAPPVILEATHSAAASVVDVARLRAHRVAR